ncbi:MAG: hypothetical protein MJY93_08515 [Fibrobacter sp.]|nr:hypothetical protein [Fibrobacter sp.]
MKKMLLAVLTAFAMCSYSYAQDDDDEYEEDEAPAKVEKKKASRSSSREEVESAEGNLAIGLDLLDAMDNERAQKFYVTFALLPNLELSGIFAFYHHGETSGDPANDDHGDNYTQLQLGVGADYFITKLALPISVGGEFLFSHWGDDQNQLDFNALAGTRVKLVGGFYASAKVGLSLNVIMDDTNGHDDSRVDFGLATRVQLHWFFM